MEIIVVNNSMLAAFSELCSGIYYENYADHWLNDDPGEYIHEQYSMESLQNQLEQNSSYYLALKDNTPIGFMKLNFGVKPFLTEDVKAIELQKIYFKLNAQRSGFGTQLLEHALDIARKHSVREIQLDVLASNQKARHFYLKHGFIEHADTNIPYAKFKPEHRAMKIMLKTII